MTTGKTIALTRQSFVGKVMSLLFNMLFRLVITFLPRSKHLLISWVHRTHQILSSPWMQGLPWTIAVEKLHLTQLLSHSVVFLKKDTDHHRNRNSCPGWFKWKYWVFILDFPGSLDGKDSTCNGGDLGLIPGLGRYPEGGHGNPLQYSYLENGQRSLVGYSPRGCKESDTME